MHKNKENSPETDALPLNITHDTFFVETFQMRRFAKAFLKVVLPAETIRKLDLDGLTILPRHLSDGMFKGKIADVLYRVPVKKTKRHIDFFAILEHKSYNDYLTIFQLWSYVYRICEQNLREAEQKQGFKAKSFRFSPVVPVIVHHGPSAFTGKTELVELFATDFPEIDPYLPRLRAILFDLNRVSDNDIPDDPEVPELKVVLTILKAVFRRDVGTKLEDIFDELEPHSDDPEYRTLIRLIWTYSFHNARHLRGDYETIHPTAHNVIGDQKMPTLAEFYLAKGKKEGKMEGKMEGKVEGKVEGKAEGKSETVLTVLRARFGAVSKDVEDTICGMSDPTALDSWAVHAATCKSLKDFAKHLD